jgi:1-acyl-sn-glycerol-3-phosphate acyltransferase
LDPRCAGLEHLKEAKEARAIVIFNHVSYTDPVILVELMAPCGLAKLGVARIPFFGKIARGLQFLFVDRKARGSGNDNGAHMEGATASMHERAADAR